MKIKLSMPGATTTVDIEENKAMKIFASLNKTLLESRNVPAYSTKEIASEASRLEKLLELATEQEDADQKVLIVESKKEPVKADEVSSYFAKGILHVKCDSCGEHSEFFAKEPVDSFRCKKCNHETKFSNHLLVFTVKCDCGQSTYFRTNSTDPFDVQCIKCRNPIAVKYNEKKKQYEMMNLRRRH